MSEFDPRPSHPIPAHDASRLPATLSPANLPMGGSLPPAPWMESSEPKSNFNLLSFFHALRRVVWKGVGLGFVLASILAALLWLLVPVKYEAQVTLRVRRSAQELLRDKFARQQLPQDFEITKQTQAALIHSTPVLEAALRRPGIAQLPLVRDDPWFGKRDNPVAWLDRQLKVEFAPGSEILQVSMKERRPEEVKKVLNAVTDAYKEEVLSKDRNEKLRNQDMLRERRRQLETGIREQWDAFGALAKTYGSQESDAEKTRIEVQQRQLMDISRQKQQVEQQYFEAYSEFTTLQQRLSSSRSAQPENWQIEDQLIINYPAYRALNEQKLQLEANISAMQSMGPAGGGRGAMGGGQMQQIQSQLAMINQQMEEFRYGHRTEAVDRVKKLDNNDERKLEMEGRDKETQLNVLTQRLKKLDADYKTLSDQLLAQSQFSAEMKVKEAAIKADQDMFDMIKQELEHLQLELDTDTQVDVLSNATIPDESNWIAKYMQIIAAWLLSLVGTVLGLSLWEMQHQRVNNTQEVIESGDVRVIGALPSLAHRWAGGLLPVSAAARRTTEAALTRSIDSIRTALQFAKRQHSYQVVLVTSALGQEGKTTVASQLAVSYARSGRRTLLIDGDVRNPQQHVVLGMPMGHGLSEVLRGECRLEDVVQATPAENLWSICAGHRDFSTDQYLASPVVGKLFQELRTRFDAIVVDTGPVLTSPDALLMGQYADAAVISVRRDVSRLPKVTEACDRLRSVGVHIAGAILNGTSADVRDSELQMPIAQPVGPQLEQA